ncbi:MAG: dephospho-CoA kinase [Lentisphaeria bacterium]
MALSVGITGGICAGKSTVLNQLKELDQYVFDADDAVHELYRPGTPVTTLLRERYGDEVTDAEGGVNRRLLADRVFNASAELQWLNDLVHPFVKKAIEQRMMALDRPLYCAVPLLFEAGWDSDVDCTVAVWCDRLTQVERLQSRGWGIAELKRRQAFQISMDEKMARADYGLINNSSPGIVKKQVQLLVDRI